VVEPPATEKREGAKSDGGPAEELLSERALSALVYAPLGLALTAWESVPELTTKGKEAVTGHLRNARVVGEFTVRKGRRELDRRIARSPFGHPAGPRPGGEAARDEPVVRVPPGLPGQRPDARAARDAAEPNTEVRNAAVSRMGGAAISRGAAAAAAGADAVTEAAVNLAIPDYEALSASQVVRRLEGLGPEDLKAVYTHESATRRRRTILNRVQQLLEPEPARREPPSGSSSESASGSA